jgi:hypothetical protein
MTAATNTLINPSTTITTATSTLTNPTITSTPNLSAPPHFFSALLNVARTAGNETANGKIQVRPNIELISNHFRSTTDQFHS